MNDNKKRINNEQELFELFCNPYSGLTFKQKPYYETQCKKVSATNGAILILIPPSMLSRNFEEAELPFINTVVRDSVDGYFTLEALKKVLASFDMEEEARQTEKEGKCKECKGSGDIEWEYTDKEGETHYRYFECPICKGEGVNDIFKSTGFMIPNDYSFVRIGEKRFRGIEAQKLLWAMEYFNVDKAAFSEGENSICFTLKNGVQIAAIVVETYGAFQNIVTLETTKQ